MRLRFDPRAIQDLRDIHSFIKEHGTPQSAERVRLHLRDRIERLIDHPLIGKKSSIADVRILPPTRYPYRIYYTILTDTVVILHVRHTARREPDPVDGIG